MRLGIITLTLGRCKPFLGMPTFDCRVSIATGPGNPQVHPCPVFPVCDRSRAAVHHVAKCHKLPYALQQTAPLFDHLVGAGEHGRRNG